MNIAYLVQGSLDDLLLIQESLPKHQYVMTLNYDIVPEDADLLSDSHIYFPDSTWAMGRNLLLKKSQELDIFFDYFVFLDADLRITKGSFEQFEDFLNTHRPKLGLPLGDQIKNSYRYLPKASIQTQNSFDQIMQAYRCDVVKESICLPYITDFDSESWWYSCEINSYLSLLRCGEEIMQFNDFEIVNSRHDGPVLNQEGLSLYRGGISAEGLNQCKGFIDSRFDCSKALIGTLFHPQFLPKVIFSPTLKQLLRNEFSENFTISIRRLVLAFAKSGQKFLFRTVFRKYYIDCVRIS